MITANIIHRVFHIRYHNSLGTGFTIDISGREYLVTARHIVETLQGSEIIELFSNGTWIQIDVHLVGHALGEADISVLATERRLTPPNLPMEAESNGLIYGQNVYFLGFPYGFLGQYNFGSDGFPLPFVKKAIVSLFNGSTYLLDGHNNPGFSGGPVVFRNSPNENFKVAAVISGYQAVEEPIYEGNQTTSLTYSYNTGIIVTHRIDFALDLVRNNLVGFAVSDTN